MDVYYYRARSLVYKASALHTEKERKDNNIYIICNINHGPKKRRYRKEFYMYI